MALELDVRRKNNVACGNCGHDAQVIDRFQDFSTTRGPMTEHMVTKCENCGSQLLLHLAAQTLGGDAAANGPKG